MINNFDWLKKILTSLKNFFLCETPEEKLLKEQWNKRLEEIIGKMKSRK
jgi:hypothetical protein